MNDMTKCPDLMALMFVCLTCLCLQDSAYLESHTFATNSLTQFRILFKRTFITICRDQVCDMFNLLHSFVSLFTYLLVGSYVIPALS